MQYDSQNQHNSMISTGYSPKNGNLESKQLISPIKVKGGYSPKNSNLEIKQLISPIKVKGSNKSNVTVTNSKNNLLNVNALNRNTSNKNTINVNQSNSLITPTTKKDSIQFPPIINSPNYTNVHKSDKSIESLCKKISKNK